MTVDRAERLLQLHVSSAFRSSVRLHEPAPERVRCQATRATGNSGAGVFPLCYGSYICSLGRAQAALSQRLLPVLAVDQSPLRAQFGRASALRDGQLQESPSQMSQARAYAFDTCVL